MKHTDDETWDILLNIKPLIHKKHGQPYLSEENENKFSDCISILRSNKNTSTSRINLLKVVLSGYKRHKKELRDKLRNQPRRDAQKFIGNKKVRQFIFNRDKKCLRCGSEKKLSIDHIVPVSKNGINDLSNLQTLCYSCNSWKSDRIIDYR